MSCIRHQPCPALARWVNCFWYDSGEPGAADPSGAHHSGAHSALPTGAIDVVFNLGWDSFEVLLPSGGKHVRTEGAIVHGPQSGYFIIAPRRRGPTAGIHFRPGGAAAFLGVPCNELSDRHLPLADLWGGRAGLLRAQLIDCNDAVQVWRTLEQALLYALQSRLQHQRHGPLVHPAISFALRSFAAASGVNRVTPIQEATGYSPRRFNTLFQQAVGLTPKRFSQIQRLRAVVEQVARGQPVEWAQVAADNGYFDQSHLNRDFRLFSGVTPGQYRPTSADSALHMQLSPPQSPEDPDRE